MNPYPSERKRKSQWELADDRLEFHFNNSNLRKPMKMS